MDKVFYKKLRCFNPFSVQYMYLDHKDFLADQLFTSEKVHVRFGREMVKEGSDYVIVFCKIRKKDEERFLRALDRLPAKMLLFGFKEYTLVCEELTGMILKDKEGVRDEAVHSA